MDSRPAECLSQGIDWEGTMAGEAMLGLSIFNTMMSMAKALKDTVNAFRGDMRRGGGFHI